MRFNAQVMIPLTLFWLLVAVVIWMLLKGRR